MSNEKTLKTEVGEWFSGKALAQHVQGLRVSLQHYTHTHTEDKKNVTAHVSI
jgi:hypothetical protein